MEIIKVDELIERLNRFKDKYVVSIFEGNIVGKIDMDFAEVNKEDNYIQIVFNKTKRDVFGKSIKIDINQIEYIKSDEDTEFYIYLNENQRIIIFTDMQVLMNYRFFKLSKMWD